MQRLLCTSVAGTRSETDLPCSHRACGPFHTPRCAWTAATDTPGRRLDHSAVRCVHMRMWSTWDQSGPAWALPSLNHTYVTPLLVCGSSCWIVCCTDDRQGANGRKSNKKNAVHHGTWRLQGRTCPSLWPSVTGGCAHRRGGGLFFKREMHMYGCICTDQKMSCESMRQLDETGKRPPKQSELMAIHLNLGIHCACTFPWWT